jgi:ribosomal protein S3AE
MVLVTSTFFDLIGSICEEMVGAFFRSDRVRGEKLLMNYCGVAMAMPFSITAFM